MFNVIPAPGSRFVRGLALAVSIGYQQNNTTWLRHHLGSRRLCRCCRIQDRACRRSAQYPCRHGRYSQLSVVLQVMPRRLGFLHQVHCSGLIVFPDCYSSLVLRPTSQARVGPTALRRYISREALSSRFRRVLGCFGPCELVCHVDNVCRPKCTLFFGTASILHVVNRPLPQRSG